MQSLQSSQLQELQTPRRALQVLHLQVTVVYHQLLQPIQPLHQSQLKCLQKTVLPEYILEE